MRHFGLSWWESLGPLDKPQTWNGMKIIMRENFVNPALVINSNDEVFQLEDQSIVVSLVMTNLLQNSEQTQEDKDDAKQNEELTTSCANSEPSPHNSHSCWPSISTIFTTNIPSDFILLGIYYYNFH